MSHDDGRYAYDWSEVDISRIAEDDFPVYCNGCACRLTGLGDEGRCPECATPFRRRQRLWELYGPEAFADPAIVPGESDAAPGDRRFTTAVFTAVAGAASLPLVIWIGQALSDSVDLLLCFIAWLLLVSCVEWILAARDKARETQHAEEEKVSG